MDIHRVKTTSFIHATRKKPKSFSDKRKKTTCPKVTRYTTKWVGPHFHPDGNTRQTSIKKIKKNRDERNESTCGCICRDISGSSTWDSLAVPLTSAQSSARNCPRFNHHCQSSFFSAAEPLWDLSRWNLGEPSHIKKRNETRADFFLLFFFCCNFVC